MEHTLKQLRDEALLETRRILSLPRSELINDAKRNGIVVKRTDTMNDLRPKLLKVIRTKSNVDVKALMEESKRI